MSYFQVIITANHRCWWPDTLIITLARAWAIISVRSSAAVVQSTWFCPGNRTSIEVDSMVVTWWIVAFLPSVSGQYVESGQIQVNIQTVQTTIQIFTGKSAKMWNLLRQDYMHNQKTMEFMETELQGKKPLLDIICTRFCKNLWKFCGELLQWQGNYEQLTITRLGTCKKFALVR